MTPAATKSCLIHLQIKALSLTLTNFSKLGDQNSFYEETIQLYEQFAVNPRLKNNASRI